MTGKSYYLTSLAAWQQNAAKFANSHFLIIDAPPTASEISHPSSLPDDAASIRIIALIEADEGVHLSLEDHPEFEMMPHPLSQKPISKAAQAALVPHGVPAGATTFDATEVLAKKHPLLRHRVF